MPAIEGDAKAGAERLQQTRAAAQEAPVRIDTLDKRLDRIENKLDWLMGVLVTSYVSGVAGACLYFLTSFKK